MPGLREVEGEDLRCRECEVRDAVGPCAACEAMICGDCGVVSKDPVGAKVICLSCARLVAAVRDRPLRRRTSTGKAIAVAIIVALAAVTLSLLLR
jgi:hypothetical protein